jgi:uncharacterized membrane protein
MFRAAIISIFLTSAALAGSHAVQVNSVGEGWVDSISNTGVAAGANSGANQYFMWTPKSGNQFIGGVSPGGGVGGRAGVSDQGAYINGSVFNVLSGHHEAGVYDVQSGTWTPLGGIGGSSGSAISSGWGISGDGSTIVGLAWEDAGTAYATTWSLKGEATSLGSTVPGSSTRANNVNEDGTVVVGWQDAAYRIGAVWVSGEQELIYRPDGDRAYEAYAVSSDGQWVSGLGIGPFSGVGDTYRYNSFTDVCEVIPNLAVGGARSVAGAGITDDGTIIVGGSWPVGPATLGNAFIWREGIGTMDLTDYFGEVGVTWPFGFHFSIATCISPNGRWIAGWGYSGSIGNTVSWFVEIPGDISCPSDVTGDGLVNVSDLLLVIGYWGSADSPADINFDGIVDVSDLLMVISNWGPCE